MKFYSNSTPQTLEPQGLSGQLYPTIPTFSYPQTTSEWQFAYSNSLQEYYSNLLMLSNQLNQQLLINNNLIVLRESNTAQQAQPQQMSSKASEVKTTTNSNRGSSDSDVPNESQAHNKLKPCKRRRVIYKEEDEYEPDEEYSNEVATHISESKNIPKNYGKAIINFILKNKDYSKKVLAYLRVNFEDFIECTHQKKNRINTIHQLRSLWLDQATPFARAFRIFTQEYLRKHSLPYIFNSRVENIHKHIKYRYKMMEGVSYPHNFTSMKEF